MATIEPMTPAEIGAQRMISIESAIQKISGFSDQYLIDRRSDYQNEMDRAERELETGEMTLNQARLHFSINFYMKMKVEKVIDDNLNPAVLDNILGNIINAQPSPTSSPRNNIGPGL